MPANIFCPLYFMSKYSTLYFLPIYFNNVHILYTVCCTPICLPIFTDHFDNTDIHMICSVWPASMMTPIRQPIFTYHFNNVHMIYPALPVNILYTYLPAFFTDHFSNVHIIYSVSPVSMLSTQLPANIYWPSFCEWCEK